MADHIASGVCWRSSIVNRSTADYVTKTKVNSIGSIVCEVDGLTALCCKLEPGKREIVCLTGCNAGRHGHVTVHTNRCRQCTGVYVITNLGRKDGEIKGSVNTKCRDKRVTAQTFPLTNGRNSLWRRRRGSAGEEQVESVRPSTQLSCGACACHVAIGRSSIRGTVLDKVIAV